MLNAMAGFVRARGVDLSDLECGEVSPLFFLVPKLQFGNGLF
jgi:hypothetical protein